MDERFQSNQPIDEQPQGANRGVRFVVFSTVIILPLAIVISLKPAAASAAGAGGAVAGGKHQSLRWRHRAALHSDGIMARTFENDGAHDQPARYRAELE